jgi:isochorismate pyruvate lyase
MSDGLTSLRQQIDSLDTELVTLLAKRENLVNEVLVYKKAHNLPGRIPSRVDEVIENAVSRAESIGMNPDLARTIWIAMVEWFVNHEERELSRGESPPAFAIQQDPRPVIKQRNGGSAEQARRQE